MKCGTVSVLLDREKNEIMGAYILLPTSKSETNYVKIINYNDFLKFSFYNSIDKKEVSNNKKIIENKKYEVVYTMYYQDFITGFQIYSNINRDKVTVLSYAENLVRDNFVNILKAKQIKTDTDITKTEIKLDEAKCELKSLQDKFDNRSKKIKNLLNSTPTTEFSYKYILGYHPKDNNQKIYTWRDENGFDIKVGDTAICDTVRGEQEVVVTKVLYSSIKIREFKKVLGVKNENRKET